MKRLEVKTPTKIIDIASSLRDCSDNYVILAGGTDLLVNTNTEIRESDTLIDLSKVQEMNYIKLIDGELQIGSNTTFSEIAESDLVKKHGRCLVQSAELVGSPQIRNRATIGGNVANCSAAADSIPPLIALGAEVGIMDSNGSRSRIKIEEFLTLEKGELNNDKCFIEYFGIPITSKHLMSGFSRIGSRSSVTISKLSIAISFQLDEKEIIQNPRIGMGAVGKTAVRMTRLEKLVTGKPLDEELITALGTLLALELEESLKGRASMPYKKRAVIGVVQDLFSGQL